jgi:hypothetical protein
MLQQKKVRRIDELDQGIDGLRKELVLEDVDGTNGTFDANYDAALDSTLVLLENEKERLDEAIRSAHTV